MTAQAVEQRPMGSGLARETGNHVQLGLGGGLHRLSLYSQANRFRLQRRLLKDWARVSFTPLLSGRHVRSKAGAKRGDRIAIPFTTA
jgi:hypothetical protein